LNPAIDILPQIAHERAMEKNLGISGKGRFEPVRRERGGTIPRTPGGSRGPHRAHEGGAVPEASIGGRALVTRRAIIDIVRRVTLGQYGVAGFAGNRIDRLLGWIENRPGGLRVSVAGGALAIRIHLRVAQGLPIAEVARQVDLAVRHAIRTALGREVNQLSIRVARLELHPGGEPPHPPQPPDLGPSDLADSGTDVA
jgi:uncharacterized alkaline shock family protein YloU